MSGLKAEGMRPYSIYTEYNTRPIRYCYRVKTSTLLIRSCKATFCGKVLRFRRVKGDRLPVIRKRRDSDPTSGISDAPGPMQV